MNRWILILAAAMLTIGCSKDGAKSHLMDGGQITQTPPQTDPQPVDGHMPGPDGKAAQ